MVRGLEEEKESRWIQLQVGRLYSQYMPDLLQCLAVDRHTFMYLTKCEPSHKSLYSESLNVTKSDNSVLSH